MQRRNFITGATAAALLPHIAKAGEATKLISGAADIEKIGNVVTVQGGDSHALMKLGKNAFLVKPQSQISFELDDSGMHVRAAKILKGAVHAAFDPQDKGQRNVLTDFATIAIRGTAHYVEVEAALKRTYSCCCYGHIHVSANQGTAAETQKTTYHDARIITARGDIKPAPYSVPLNHYDDTLVEMERCVNRAPRWVLPGGKLNFFAPFEFGA